MRKQEILEKAFKKAKRNGWKQSFWTRWSDNAWEDYSENDEHLMWIFKHDFARAFFGEKPFVWKETSGRPYILASGKAGSLTLKTNGDWEVSMQEWEYHLQQMILEKEPLKYLEQFLVQQR